LRKTAFTISLLSVDQQPTNLFLEKTFALKISFGIDNQKTLSLPTVFETLSSRSGAMLIPIII